MPVLIVNRLKPGADLEQLKKIIPEHLAWLRERISEGSILQAGKWGSIGGLAIVDGDNIDEAEKLINKDPLIKSGLVTFESDMFFPLIE